MPHVRSAVGVFFVEGPRFSLSHNLEGPLHTHQKAELKICKLALDAWVHMIIEEPEVRFRQTIFKTCSEYVAKGLTVWVIKWRENSYLNAKRQPVTHASLFREINEKLEELEELVVKVLFRLIRREENPEADALVNAAFDIEGYKG